MSKSKSSNPLLIDGLDHLQEIWSAYRTGGPGSWSAEQYVKVAKQCRNYGQRAMANDVLVEAASDHPKSVEVTYTHALILADGGAREASATIEELLGGLPASHRIRPDALALRGRIAKDRFANLEPGSTAARRAIRQSVAAYGEAYAISADPFHGINEASTRRLAGEERRSHTLTLEVKRECLERQSRNDQPGRWLCATIAEASLLLGDEKEAAAYYRKTLSLSRAEPGAADVIRRQVNRLSKAIEIPAGVKAALKIGPVVVFTGHMIDTPGKPARFPPEAVEVARAAIGDALDSLGPAVGFCSLACGGDLLFFEEMQNRRLERRVYLPFERSDFERESVSFAGEEWVKRYRRAYRGARRSIRYAVRDGYLGDDCLFDFNNQFMQGEALLQARSWGTECILLALLDGGSKNKVGGAMDVVAQRRALGGKVELVDYEPIRQIARRQKRKRRSARIKDHGTAARPDDLPHGRRSIRTMLFADMVGFSKLKEPRLPAFFELYLGKVERLLTSLRGRVPFFNTWGDGLYLVFDTVEDGAEFSLRLRDVIQRTNWEKYNLPAETGIRIGLHTGPVFRGRDPVLRRINVFGAHVNHAARIEPVVLPGTVYVSEQTAALLAASENRSFDCDYLGEVEFAKKYGAFVLYRLRRRGEAD